VGWLFKKKKKTEKVNSTKKPPNKPKLVIRKKNVGMIFQK